MSPELSPGPVARPGPSVWCREVAGERRGDLNIAPVPADRGGLPSSASKFVLVGLANHSGPDGAGAFPSVATLVRYTGLSVRTCLDRLEAQGIISPCDPDIVAAWIKRAGHHWSTAHNPRSLTP
jgi:hypothetical protein